MKKHFLRAYVCYATVHFQGPLKKIRKRLVFVWFQEVRKEISGIKWVKIGNQHYKNQFLSTYLITVNLYFNQFKFKISRGDVYNVTSFLVKHLLFIKSLHISYLFSYGQPDKLFNDVATNKNHGHLCFSVLCTLCLQPLWKGNISPFCQAAKFVSRSTSGTGSTSFSKIWLGTCGTYHQAIMLGT